jgi:protein-S-isoprenylcysteine O-methyltransferase Ste14
MNPLLAILTNPFWFSFGLGLYFIRIFADYFRIRVVLKRDKTGTIVVSGLYRKRLHVHHFLLGFPLWIVAAIFFALNRGFEAFLIAGLSCAFWASETKELILQKWSR